MSEEPIAIREYARRVGVSDTAVHKAIKAGKITARCLTIHPANKRRMIYESLANEDWGRYVAESDRAAPALVDKFSQQPPTQKTPTEFLPADGTMNAAKKAKAVYDAKMAELKYKQQAGALVLKDEVFKHLFSMGQELRDALLTIPDRVIDDVLACKTRAEAHTMMHKAIHSELERLTDHLKRMGDD